MLRREWTTAELHKTSSKTVQVAVGQLICFRFYFRNLTMVSKFSFSENPASGLTWHASISQHKQLKIGLRILKLTFIRSNSQSNPPQTPLDPYF